MNSLLKTNLPLRSFSSFKVVTGFVFLFFTILFPAVGLVSMLIALVVGRAHSLGAWLGMWRAKKIGYYYGAALTVCSFLFGYWGFKVVEYNFLVYITAVMFAIHYMYDEYDLLQTRMTLRNASSILTPLILIVSYLSIQYYKIEATLMFFILITVCGVLIELVHIDTIDWLFIQTKILIFFFWLMILKNYSAQTVIGILLTFHYFIWFLFPVYKLHKYKREERDPFIVMLIVIVSTTIYLSLTSVEYRGTETFELSMRAFMVGTLLHILFSAPFGYVFGLKKSAYTYN